MILALVSQGDADISDSSSTSAYFVPPSASWQNSDPETSTGKKLELM
jgi:hypothetical protein